MADPHLQRHYRAPCPGCGAPVEFRSAQSTHAVCPYCQSTVVRSGEVLTRVGKMAEVFDDHSPLQLMASGRVLLDAREQSFTLIGRLQYQAETGTWAEWNAILEDGSTATLGEDNGAYVFTRPMDPGRELPPPERFRVGTTTAVSGKPYSVAANVQAHLVSAQGELPRLPPLGQPFAVVELRSEQGDVLSFDYGQTPPRVERGRTVRLEDLRMQGLKNESAKEEKARQFNCPHCGAPVAVKFDTTRSLTCPSCASLIDVSGGIGGELRHAVQDEPVQPLIPLGTTGQLEGGVWQVVGFQHRMGSEPGDDESFGWDEYLLYNRQRGFAFLVDATDGWSLVRPTTGAPKLSANGQGATYLGSTYRLDSQYRAETTYVLGEFYWPVARGQVTQNRDFSGAGGRGRLSMEQTPREITWSAGNLLDSALVAKAFKLDGQKDLFRRDDASPLASAGSVGCGTVIIIAVVLVLLLLLFSRGCSSSCDPQRENCTSSSYRSSGGSFGGWSSGGGHK
ncbi:DUF4178 domain-containing protein [Paracidovorax anthurii]|uniref:Uncharacterized protein DUF4178 n=1 Tax=Paracidovorax anthurii TaxID=78229 RepID=A0A328ZKF1_9BURK|nr:DUF4178 domain-containing protein [Paracidovorax anthurii]RAR85122.1 uncharacterized protein DUF4178 [Paracidovorax anthurii]